MKKNDAFFVVLSLKDGFHHAADWNHGFNLISVFFAITDVEAIGSWKTKKSKGQLMDFERKSLKRILVKNAAKQVAWIFIT